MLAAPFCSVGETRATASQPLDAEPLLREVAGQARTIAGEKSIDVRVRVDGSALPVRGDVDSLRRLLLILVDNAVKFTPPGGTVTLHGSRDTASVTLSVADTGVGITSGDQAHIFERFWRADKVRPREAGAAGLGLSIARQIAEEHAATLTVESEVGRGSVFALRLPALDERAGESPAHHA